jgi:hypothetical protein
MVNAEVIGSGYINTITYCVDPGYGTAWTRYGTSRFSHSVAPPSLKKTDPVVFDIIWTSNIYFLIFFRRERPCQRDAGQWAFLPAKVYQARVPVTAPVTDCHLRQVSGG